MEFKMRIFCVYAIVERDILSSIGMVGVHRTDGTCNGRNKVNFSRIGKRGRMGGKKGNVRGWRSMRSARKKLLIPHNSELLPIVPLGRMRVAAHLDGGLVGHRNP